jgi:hypothetical protein
MPSKAMWIQPTPLEMSFFLLDINIAQLMLLFSFTDQNVMRSSHPSYACYMRYSSHP